MRTERGGQCAGLLCIIDKIFILVGSVRPKHADAIGEGQLMKRIVNTADHSGPKRTASSAIQAIADLGSAAIHSTVYNIDTIKT